MKTVFALCAVVGVAASVSSATTVTFAGLTNAEILNTQYAGSPDFLTISAINPNRSHDIAAVFDTLTASAPDPDLNGPPWSTGNLAPNTVFGNVAIISQVGEDPGNPGFTTGPNDEGNRPAGRLILEWSVAFEAFQIDVIDIEGNVEGSSFDFYSGATFLGNVSFLAFADIGSAYYDASVQFGDNSANRLPVITAASLGAASFDRVVINVGGSSGWDNISASGFLPAPGTLALGFGLAGLGARRRRR